MRRAASSDCRTELHSRKHRAATGPQPLPWTTDWYRDSHGDPHSSDVDALCCVPTNPSGPDVEASFDPNQPKFPIPLKVIKGGSFVCADNYCRRYRPAARRPQMVDIGTQSHRVPHGPPPPLTTWCGAEDTVAAGGFRKEMLTVDRRGRVARAQRNELELIGLRTADRGRVAGDGAEHARRTQDRHGPRAADEVLPSDRAERCPTLVAAAVVDEHGCAGCRRDPRRPASGGDGEQRRRRRAVRARGRRRPSIGAAGSLAWVVWSRRCTHSCWTPTASANVETISGRLAAGSTAASCSTRLRSRQSCRRVVESISTPVMSATTSSGCTSRGERWATMSPPRSTAIRSATLNTWSSRCDTSRMQLPAARIRAIRPRRGATPPRLVRPSVRRGSAAMVRGAPPARFATSCRCPPESVATGASGSSMAIRRRVNSRRPSSAIVASSSSRLCRRSFPRKRFATVLRLSHSARSCQTTAMRFGCPAVESDPFGSRSIRPPSAFAAPTRHCTSVDLPAPFSPTRARISPAAQVEVDAAEHPERAEPFPQAPDAQHRARRRVSARFLTGILQMRHPPSLAHRNGRRHRGHASSGRPGVGVGRLSRRSPRA